MADMELAGQGSVQSQSSVVSSPPVESPKEISPSSSPNYQETKSLPSEKLFTQSELDKIVGRNREEFRDKYYNQGKQDALSDYNRQSNQQNLGGIAQQSPEEIERIVEQKIKERSQAEAANTIAQDFIGKMQTGKDKYSDFEETVASLNLPAHPHVIYWANSLDNTVDVVYDIAKHPEKFASILMLAQTAPELARRKMQELSQSITKNAEASKQPHVNEPLSQLKPSTIGTDNGSMTVRDLRRQSWMKA